ncbi:MAG: DUF969 domain-containing protein [Elusimicrobiota bacterium]|jgi:uncharacterized membrane protein|nr:DUF969 domain-containing protein [Elusimicrobiota bacterium]
MEVSELLRLSGVVIVVLGLLFKFNPLLVVLVAGVTTGLVSHLSLVEILEAIGNAFVSNRAMSMLVLTLPVIGICERYGLREQAEHVIKKIAAATTGRVISLYILIRQATVAVGLIIGGHPAMVRPLISPMAEAAAAAKSIKELPPSLVDKIRGMAASSENLGNFFGQNIFPAAGGVIYIVSTMSNAGIVIEPIDVALWSIPTGIAALIVAVARYMVFDKQISREIEKLGGAK